MSAVLKENERVASVKQIEDLGKRERLSDYLPYLAFDAGPDKDKPWNRYFLADGADQPHNVGYIWECVPLTFASEGEMDKLAGLLRHEFPEQTVIQFILYPDDHIEPILRRYQLLKTRDDDVSQTAAKHFADYLLEGRDGIKAMSDIPVRNFRLFCTVKSPHETGLPDKSLAYFEEVLRQVKLNPRRMPLGSFLEFMRRLFNGKQVANPHAYNPNDFLRNQLIQSDTIIRKKEDVIQLGDQWVGCVTPMVPPTNEHVFTLAMNQVVGGYMGFHEDTAQMTHRFLWTTTIFFKSTPSSIRRKIQMMAAQKPGASIAKRLFDRNQEGLWVQNELETNPYCNVITSMLVFGKTEDDVDAGIARAVSLWEKQKFIMQRDSAVLLPLFLASLPFGLYLKGKNIEVLRRDFEVSVHAAAHFAPLQGDFGGYMAPAIVTIGRKGQIQTIDVFDPNVNNHNFFVCADSGAGKSFSLNNVVANYYGARAKIRIVDIGYSYRKQCSVVGGRYVDIGAELAGKLVINPFHSVARDEEDAKADEGNTANILLTMTFSSTGTSVCTETHFSLMKDAIRFAKARDGGILGIDHVYEFLKTYPKFANVDDQWAGAQEIAREIAFNIRDFTSTGKHGRLFNGKTTLDLSKDEFVVLELDRIINDKELFSVISMSVLNSITMDLYLSDRKDRRFMLFDEAWKYFNEAPMIANIIEEGYRRARKYGGSTGIVTQSPLDLKAFGRAGTVVRSNSAFKFFLQSGDYERAVREGVLDYDGLLLELAKSVKNQKPHYSEILFDTPHGAGVGRLAVDRWTYWMFSSSATEVAMYQDLINKGLTPRQAIDHLAATA